MYGEISLRESYTEPGEPTISMTSKLSLPPQSMDAAEIKISSDDRATATSGDINTKVSTSCINLYKDILLMNL